MDYKDWMKGESEGTMKLNKIVREIMATYCPFAKQIRAKIETQPAFEDAMARQKRELIKKVRELDLRYRGITKDGVKLPKELEQTLEYYKEG